MRDLELLWGGIINDLAFDLVAHRISILVETIDDDHRAEHRLRFEGVTEARFFDEIGEDWSYADLTEAYCESGEDGSILTEIVLWSETAGLTIRSREVVVNGERVKLDSTDEGV